MHEPPHLVGVLWRYLSVITFGDLAVERGEVAGLEWHFQFAKFVDQATQGPDIALAAVLLSRPHLRTSVVRRSCLRGAEAVLSHLRHIEIAQFGNPLHEENIGALDISVDNIVPM